MPMTQKSEKALDHAVTLAAALIASGKMNLDQNVYEMSGVTQKEKEKAQAEGLRKIGDLVSLLRTIMMKV